MDGLLAARAVELIPRLRGGRIRWVEAGDVVEFCGESIEFLKSGWLTIWPDRMQMETED